MDDGHKLFISACEFVETGGEWDRGAVGLVQLHEHVAPPSKQYQGVLNSRCRCKSRQLMKRSSRPDVLRRRSEKCEHPGNNGLASQEAQEDSMIKPGIFRTFPCC